MNRRFLVSGSTGVRGFTLIELLVVITIMILLVSFAVPAVTSLSKSNNLSGAGRVVANMLTVARSEAINRRALIRFEIATDWPTEPRSAYRKYTLVQHDQTTGTDTQLTGWETLPSGTVFQPQDPLGGSAPAGSGKYFFALNQVQNPSLKVGGSPVQTTYIEFNPTGALNVSLPDSPVRLRVEQGGFNPTSSTIDVTGTNNWYEMSVDALIGRIKISRP